MMAIIKCKMCGGDLYRTEQNRYRKLPVIQGRLSVFSFRG